MKLVRAQYTTKTASRAGLARVKRLDERDAMLGTYKKLIAEVKAEATTMGLSRREFEAEVIYCLLNTVQKAAIVRSEKVALWYLAREKDGHNDAASRGTQIDEKRSAT